jgi:hypothetical protein
METRYYKCEFLTDIVLNASSNTQGNIALSEFIPGSNFLGITASGYLGIAESGYKEFTQNEAFDIFHSGDVCFGDAHPLIDNKVSFKIPLSFHDLKVGDGYYNRLLLSDEEEQKLREEQKQLKQIRSGFMNEEFRFLSPQYNYSQKSARDARYARSKDGLMFGYSALKKGSEWVFKIDFKDVNNIEKVEKYLLGDKRLGKSKSSQYGKIHISKTDTSNKVESFKQENELTYIYLNSRVILFDADGNFTAEPTIENMGLSSGEIVWEKTYIKTSTYNPYNYKRETKEYTRVCLNKGSVIAIKGLKGEVKNRVGAFLSEGFGEIVVNPWFLKEKMPSLSRVHKKEPEQNSSENHDKNLISFLAQKEQNEKDKFEVSSHVQRVYTDFIGPSKSQWSEIRALASKSKDQYDLINKIGDYINNGVAKKQWVNLKGKLCEEIKSSEKSIEFVKLLSMIAREHTKGGNDES